MERIQADKNFDFSVYTPGINFLPDANWLVGESTAGEISLPTSAAGTFLEPQALLMLQKYTYRPLFFTLEKLNASLLLVKWFASSVLQEKSKRAFDLIVALLLLPVLLPFMLLAAAAIRLDSPGPIIFRQTRVGKWGRQFTCYKFRSMFINAEALKAQLMQENEADEIVFKIKHDPRITRVGRIIRKLSIDELPQIFNVIKGDMSIVGPRPPVPSEVAQYQYDYYRRLDTIPGITGLQQVSGRSNLPFRRWVELDIEYIQHQCLKKDIEIVFKTIPAVISGKGAY